MTSSLILELEEIDSVPIFNTFGGGSKTRK
jgi:hypothetical protein